MIRRLELLLVVAAALAALSIPAMALADAPVGAWQITRIVLDGQTIAATGKLTLNGTTLGASVGCNSIGGQASLDRTTLTVTGDLATTLIGCPADIGAAESALMKILTSGPITLTADRWTSSAGEIDVVDASGANGGGGATGCIPPIAPGANPGDNVTVPCGNGGSDIGVLSTVGTPVDGPPGPDPMTVIGLVGVVVLIVATIAAFVYLGPRRQPDGSRE